MSALGAAALVQSRAGCTRRRSLQPGSPAALKRARRRHACGQAHRAGAAARPPAHPPAWPPLPPGPPRAPAPPGPAAPCRSSLPWSASQTPPPAARPRPGARCTAQQRPAPPPRCPPGTPPAAAGPRRQRAWARTAWWPGWRRSRPARCRRRTCSGQGAAAGRLMQASAARGALRAAAGGSIFPPCKCAGARAACSEDQRGKAASHQSGSAALKRECNGKQSVTRAGSARAGGRCGRWRWWTPPGPAWRRARACAAPPGWRAAA